MSDTRGQSAMNLGLLVLIACGLGFACRLASASRKRQQLRRVVFVGFNGLRDR